MDFVHNPYRCGPLRVGRYAVGPISQIRILLAQAEYNNTKEDVHSLGRTQENN